MLKNCLAPIIGLVLIAATLSDPASAHTHLKSAVPAPDSVIASSPQEVRIEFSENIEPSMSAIEIVGANGPAGAAGKAFVEPVAPGTLVVKLAQPLPAGSYDARWRCVGKDSHVMRGSYHFEVRP